MRALYLNFIIASFALILFSCKKPDSSISGGGKGGSATIVIVPAHGNSVFKIDSGIAYIKYGSLDAPPNGVYDDSVYFTKMDTLNVAIFDSLKTGIYNIAAYGVHYGYSPPNVAITSCPITIDKVSGTFPGKPTPFSPY